jgi:hypothetical protein
VALLRESGLEMAALHDPPSRISRPQQQLSIQQAALALGGRVGLGVDVGSRLHLTTYGIAGYAMLTSPTVDGALIVMQRYAPLLNMKFRVTHAVQNGLPVLRFENEFNPDHAQRTLCLELELAKMVTLLRDLLGDEFAPREVRIRMPARDFSGRGRYFAFAKLDELSHSELRFDARLLRRPLPLPHAGARLSCLQVCDSLMEALTEVVNLPQRVKRLLLDAEGAHRHSVRRGRQVVPVAAYAKAAPRVVRHVLREDPGRCPEDARGPLPKRYCDDRRDHCPAFVLQRRRQSPSHVQALDGRFAAPVPPA